MDFTAYRTVLADPAARAFSAAGLLARMPMSMTGLGIVLLVALTSGSYGRAGLVAAAATLTGALVAPGWGRALDRRGQAPVLLAAVTIWSVGLVVVVGSVLAGLPLFLTFVGAVLVGLGFSSAGSAVRARWADRLGGTDLLPTAYAVEAVLDEVVFIFGPVLVTTLATARPALGLVVGGGLGLVGALVLASQRRTEPPVLTAGSMSSADGMLRRLFPLVAVFAAMGGVFGGMDVIVVAFADRAGVLRYAGLILMTWAVGSLVAGVLTGSLSWRASPAQRLRVSAGLWALTLLPLPFIVQPVTMAAGLLISGFGIAPTLIAATTVAQASVPARRLSEALAWTTTGLATGVAAGAAGAGQLVDRFGARAGFLGLVGVGALLLAATWTVRSDPGPAAVPPVAPTPQPG